MDTTSTQILILGASSDIGQAIMQGLAKLQGVSVLAVARRENFAVPSVENFATLGGIDLTETPSLTRLSESAKDFFEDRPFSMIHCVGDFWIHKPLVATPISEISRMLNSHVFTLMAAAHALTPIMIENGGGRLIAFSCNSVGYNYPDMSPFTASKAAVESFVKCFSNEYAEFGISATALALSTIRTPKVEIEKATGDLGNYVTPVELADYIIGTLLTQPKEVTGNVVKLFRYSRTFYHSSYYDRNPRRQSGNEP